MPIDERTINHVHMMLRPAPLEQHVAATWRNERPARYDAILGLDDVDLAKAIESFGKGRGEFLRHVLHDHDAWADTRQRR